MISTCIKFIGVVAVAISITNCSSSSGSASAGTRVSLAAAPSPANTVAQPAGAKSFTTAGGVSITLTKAYIVVASATIETACGASFSAMATDLLDLIIPVAHAHTTATPTSTGEPTVINLLAVDGGTISLGSVSPPAGDYCGVDIDLLAADADAANLPTDVSMVGKTLHIEGTYDDGVNPAGSIHISTGAALQNKALLLSALLAISGNNLNGTINVAINYDTWFDGVDMIALEAETATTTNPVDTNVGFVLENITKSIHQL